METEVLRLIPITDDAGDRLDSYIAGQTALLSRSAVQRLISQGHVAVNGRQQRASYRVRGNDEITVRIPPPERVDIQPEDIPLDILYEDAYLLAVNKPSGLVVHPGAGNPSGTLVNAVLAHCPNLKGIGGEIRPGIVHRLDKLTSGVLVVAKTDQAIRNVQRQFQQRKVTKHYQALVHGHLTQESGYIDAPIARHQRRRQTMTIASRGKTARTQWTVMARYVSDKHQPFTLLDVNLLTGRTHQIRVHLAWLGYPVAGDVVYGYQHPALGLERQWLHAYTLSIRHPDDGRDLTFEAPLPPELTTILDELRLA